MTMTLSTFQTQIDAQGTGEPVLLISGAADDLHAWDLVRPGLASFQTIAFDNRDIGQGPRGPERYSIADMARDAIEVLNETGTVKAHVIGHSLGSFIAQEVALQAPSRVESLTLIGSMAKPDGYFDAMCRLWQTWAIELSSEDLTRGGIFFWLGAETISAVGMESLVAEIAPALAAQGPGAFVRQVEAALGHDTLSRLGQIRAPTLVVFGEDETCTRENHALQLVAGIPDARLVRIPGVGHSPTVEAPDALSAAIAGFLATV